MKKYMKGLIGKKGKNDDATSTISHEARLFRDKGDSYSNQGNYNEAVVMYLAALEKAPANAELLLSLSLARMMSTPPQLALALQDVQEVIQRYPEHSEAHIRKADICERLNKLGEAEVALQRAIQLTTDMSRKMVAQGMLANVRTKQAQAQLMPNPPIMVTPPATTTAQSIPTIVTASPLASTSQNAWGMQTPAAPASSSVAVNPETPLSPQPSRPSPNTAGVASALPIPSASTASSSRGTTGQVQQRRPVATPSAPAATSSGPAVTPSTAAATPYLSPCTFDEPKTVC